VSFCLTEEEWEQELKQKQKIIVKEILIKKLSGRGGE